MCLAIASTISGRAVWPRMMPILQSGRAPKPSLSPSTRMPGLSAHSGSTEIARPDSTAAVMTVAEKLENSTRYSRFILSSTSQAARRQMQVGRPNAIGSTSCSCVAWLAEVTQSSGSRRTTSDWPRASWWVTMARSRLPRLMCSTSPGVGSQMTVSSTRGLERAKRAMISGRKRSA